jgi:hypothetical protein
MFLKISLKNEGRYRRLEKRKNLMLQHLDTTKFYHKSGLMGSKSISLRKTSMKRKKQVLT